MDTFILSDLHLSLGEPGQLFAGSDVLPQLLTRLVASAAPVRLILNGDTFDFLCAEGELSLDAVRASAAMRELLQGELGGTLMRRLGELLAQGGEVIIRLGNHDLELALPLVQAQLRLALGQPDAVAQRLAIVTGERPMLIEVGGTQLLVTHGEHDDPFNRIDYPRLLESATAESTKPFRYPAGSLLVRNILAPLRQRYGLHFLDFLKPDFQGAALVALAVAPTACRELFQAATWDIGWQLLRSASASLDFAAVDGAAPAIESAPELGLADRIDEAQLSAAERVELHDWLSPPEHAYSFSSPSLPSRLSAKLARTGLSLYARAHRAVAARAGAEFFRLEPGADELKEATALAGRHSAAAVLTGHSHAARFASVGSVLYINSGTWIWLLRMPPPDAGVEVWTAWLAELQENPRLESRPHSLVQKERLLTMITAHALPQGGARLTLSECRADGSIAELRAAELPPRSSLPSSSSGGLHVQRSRADLSK